MKRQKGSLLQRMMAVLLSAVLIMGMVWDAAPMTVLANEDTGSFEDTGFFEETGSGYQETVSGNDAGTVEGDTKPEEEPAEETDSEDQKTPEAAEGAEETPEPEAVSGNDAEPEADSKNPAADEENGNLQALLAQIAALPDAEEYLAAEPDADSAEADADAYEQWLAGLYAHAEEALAIQEAVEGLSEEEQAAIPEEALAKLAAWVEMAQTAGESAQMMAAAETHTHPVCGTSCKHSDTPHLDVEWTPLTQDSITANSENDYYKLDSGYYYLTEDISIDRRLKCSGEVSLCFNGHKITSSLKGTSTGDSSLAAYKFNACDCGSGGGFISAGKYLLTGTGYAKLNLYGGNFVGETTVFLYTDTLTLDGATLQATDRAVNIQAYGTASIQSGSATSSDSYTVIIFSEKTPGFTMSGGTVTNTSSSGSALSFSSDSVGTITGGTIIAQGSSGKGVAISYGASVTLSGSPSISGGGGDISVGRNSKITADNLTARYGIVYASPDSITEAAPVAFTVVAPDDYSGYFEASDALGKSGLALRKSGASGNEQTVEIYRPHKLTYYAEVPATCTADGKGEYWKCTNKDCGKLFSDADGNTEITGIPVNSALGHDYSWKITKEPTATAGGTAEGTCRNNSSHKETKALPLLTDTTVWTVGAKVEPTQNTDGSQTYTSQYGTVTVTFPSYAKIVAAAKPFVEDALAGITATNATTKEEILGVINTALDEAAKTNADIAGVTVTIDKFRKVEASTIAAGGIEGVVSIECGGAMESLNMNAPIAQLTQDKYIDSGNGWTLDKDGKLTIESNVGMEDWTKDWDKEKSDVKTVEIKDGVTSITGTAFSYCENLTSITIPSGVTSIEGAAFIDCKNLTGITIPSGVISIGNQMFHGCEKLASITLPSGVTSIGRHAFKDCSSLTGITLPDSVESIGEGAFSDCSSLTGITLSANLKSMGRCAFLNCSSLTGIVLPDSLESIGDSAFCDCSSLKDIRFGTGLTNIEGWAFARCSSLTGITIPGNVTGIGAGVFSGCSALEKVTMLRSTPPSLGSDSFKDCKCVSGSIKGIHVPAGTASAYQGAGGWTVYKEHITDGTLAHTHTLTLTPAKAPTCTANGNTTYYVCGGSDGCGKWFSDAAGTAEITDQSSVVIAKTEHEYDETAWGYKGAAGHAHKCKNCDAHDTVQAHTLGGAATAETPQTCTVCGYIIAPATGTEPGTGTATPEVRPVMGTIVPEVRPGENVPVTDISTPAAELEDMLLTEEEKQQLHNGIDVRIVLEVQDAGNNVSSSDRSGIRRASGGYAMGQYLNIDLYKLVGEKRTDITETAQKLRIVIAVPEGLKNTGGRARTFAVVRVHNGSAELLPDLDSSPDTITIETDRFSTYAIVYKNTSGSAPVRDGEPKTGDETHLELYATLAMIAGFAYLLLYVTDPERGMTEERKQELVSRLVSWAKRGGRLRRCLALAAIFVLLVYYHGTKKLHRGAGEKSGLGLERG